MAVTYGSLTFSDALTDPASTGLYALLAGTFTEAAHKRATIDHEYLGVDGILSIDGGDRPRMFAQTALMVGYDLAGIVAARNAILAAQNGGTNTLTAHGEALAAVELLSVSFGKMSTGRFTYQEAALTWRKL